MIHDLLYKIFHPFACRLIFNATMKNYNPKISFRSEYMKKATDASFTTPTSFRNWQSRKALYRN